MRESEIFFKEGLLAMLENPSRIKIQISQPFYFKKCINLILTLSDTLLQDIVIVKIFVAVYGFDK